MKGGIESALRRLALAAVALALAACAIVRDSSQSALDAFPPVASGAPPGASPKAMSAARALRRGVNFGNMLEAPAEGAWGVRLDDSFFDLVAEAGFTSVRLPVRWSNHASSDAAATIDEAFARRVDHVIDALLGRGLTVVVNMHHYRQLDGDTLDRGERRVPDEVKQLRFLNMWRQIAQRYRDKPDALLFELYNEPHGDQQSSWNELAARALGVVRARNPGRTVVIGPVSWNSARALKDLQLPNDPHLIVTFYLYDPVEFTHQGAPWMSLRLRTGVDCCSEAQRQQIVEMLNIAAQWGRSAGYPMWLGEFGAYGQAAMDARERYTRFMRDEAERRRISWAYWEFAAGFGVYDPTARQWREPLKQALLGK